MIEGSMPPTPTSMLKPHPSWSKEIVLLVMNVFFPPKEWYAYLADGRMLLLHLKRGQICVYWSSSPTNYSGDAWDGPCIYSQGGWITGVSTNDILKILHDLNFTYKEQSLLELTY